jgi:hypothetical protein
MRTKVLLSLAAFAVSAFAAYAQSNVYSVNIVGYVNVTCNPGYTLIANPLVQTNQQISQVLTEPMTPAGSEVFKFDGANFIGNTLDEFGGGWSNPTDTLDNGDGWFFKNNSGSATTLTFVGEVASGSKTNALPAGITAAASIIPFAGFAEDIGLSAAPGDNVVKYRSGNFVTYFNDEFGGGWSSSEIDYDPIKGPNISVAEGILYYNNGGGTPTWIQTLNPQNP